VSKIAASTLLEAKIPDARQRVTARDHAFYALSIGYGQDPAEPTALRYVDPAPTMAVVPSVALVLGYPGFWLGSPALGLDAARIVHVAQEIELHRPIPVEAEVVGRTRVTGLWSRGDDRGLALASERTLADGVGRPLATLRQRHFLLGDACADAPPLPRETPEEGRGEGAAAMVVLPTRPEQALFYRLNGDRNPLHSDPATAAAAGFPAPILHGMCTFGVVTRAVVAHRCAGDGTRLRRIAMRFRGVVYPGETLTLSVDEDGRFTASVPERQTVVVDQGRCSPSD